MDLTIVVEYLSPIIVLACLIVGWVVKNVIPNETINRFIPIIVMCLGIFLNIWSSGWIIELPIILTGAISGLASTGLYEAFDQIIKNMNSKTDFVEVDIQE